MVHSLHYARSGILHGSHLLDFVEDVSATHLWVRKPFPCMLLTSHSIIFLGPQYARFSPKFYYWVFIVRTPPFSSSLLGRISYIKTISSHQICFEVMYASVGISY